MSPSGSDNEGNENRRLAEGEAEAIFSSYGLTESSLKERPSLKYVHRDSEVFLADVEADAQTFSNQLYSVMRYGPEEIPCAVLDDSGPVPLDYLDFAKAAWGTPTGNTSSSLLSLHSHFVIGFVRCRATSNSGSPAVS
jgi:hypothetical protein